MVIEKKLFEEMETCDFDIEADLIEMEMSVKGIPLTSNNFNNELNKITYDYWKIHIFPTRKNEMIRLFGESEYLEYEKITEETHWEK